MIGSYKGTQLQRLTYVHLNRSSSFHLKIHLENNAKPRACRTSAHVPIHWQKQVEADLIRDEKWVSWNVSHLVNLQAGVTRKQYRSPTRTLDLSALNKYCKRERICASETPSKLARRIPKGTFKTVTDAWNG